MQSYKKPKAKLRLKKRPEHKRGLTIKELEKFTSNGVTLYRQLAEGNTDREERVLQMAKFLEALDKKLIAQGVPSTLHNVEGCKPSSIIERKLLLNVFEVGLDKVVDLKKPEEVKLNKAIKSYIGKIFTTPANNSDHLAKLKSIINTINLEARKAYGAKLRQLNKELWGISSKYLELTKGKARTDIIANAVTLILGYASIIESML